MNCYCNTRFLIQLNKAFQNAVHRYARRIQLLHNRSLHTTLPCAAKEAYEAFERFVKIEYPGGTCVLSAAFNGQVERAMNAASAEKANRAAHRSGRRIEA